MIVFQNVLDDNLYYPQNVPYFSFLPQNFDILCAYQISKLNINLYDEHSYHSNLHFREGLNFSASGIFLSPLIFWGRSKVKCGLLGFTTAFSIFGLTMFGPKLAAMAKDLPAPEPAKTPSSPSSKESEKIVKGLAGAAASVCFIAVQSGSFLVGIACGVVVGIGILKTQGK